MGDLAGVPIDDLLNRELRKFREAHGHNISIRFCTTIDFMTHVLCRAKMKDGRYLIDDQTNNAIPGSLLGLPLCYVPNISGLRIESLDGKLRRTVDLSESE